MTRRIFDISVTGKTVLVADQLLMNCRYEPTQPGDRPEELQSRLLRQAHRVATSKVPDAFRREGVWDAPNPDKWQKLGASQ